MRRGKTPGVSRTDALLRALCVSFVVIAGCAGSIGDPTRPSGDGFPSPGDDDEGPVFDAGAPTPGSPDDEPDGSEPDQPGPDDMTEGDASLPSNSGEADKVWSALTVIKVVNPMDFGAKGDGNADDLGALNKAIAALPNEGGIVFLPNGKTFKKTNLLTITKSHVKLWSVNRSAQLFQSIGGVRGRQSTLFRNATGSGVFGVKLRSDASARFGALEDHMISFDRGTQIEVVGSEVQGSSAGGIFMTGTTETYIEGNYVHHTYADHIHHTGGAKTSWVWNNFIFNEAPSNGDDGVACVTYGANSTRCSDMEWWHNKILHSGHGRGYSVIGGNDIQIHDNWAIGVAGAGVIVASEPAYGSASSKNISVLNNYVYKCGHTIKHPGLLVSGLYQAAGPITDVGLKKNVSVEVPAGPYRAEGSLTNVTNTDMSSVASALPKPMPDQPSVKFADTSSLRTRDVSFAPSDKRAGLYRIHVRPNGSSYQQRFEYVVKGAKAAIDGFTKDRKAAGDYVSEQRTVGSNTYALVLCKAPIALPSGVSALPHRELRSNDSSDKLSWLWDRIDTGRY